MKHAQLLSALQVLYLISLSSFIITVSSLRCSLIWYIFKSSGSEERLTLQGLYSVENVKLLTYP